MSGRLFGCVLSLICTVSTAAMTQTPSVLPQSQKAQQSVPQTASDSTDELTQMRNDLNQLSSLNDVMSTEIEFLHDQNLQILLRTNSRMWRVLIADMQRRVEREEQRRGRTAPAAEKSTPPERK